jgi:hypothetical protein
MKILEVVPDTSFNCINGEIGQKGSPTYAPIINACRPFADVEAFCRDGSGHARECPPAGLDGRLVRLIFRQGHQL